MRRPPGKTEGLRCRDRRRLVPGRGEAALLSWRAGRPEELPPRPGHVARGATRPARGGLRRRLVAGWETGCGRGREPRPVFQAPRHDEGAISPEKYLPLRVEDTSDGA